jgi:phage FluMu protein Com
MPPIVKCCKCDSEPVQSVLQGYYKIECPICGTPNGIPQRVPIGASKTPTEKFEKIAAARTIAAKLWNSSN